MLILKIDWRFSRCNYSSPDPSVRRSAMQCRDLDSALERASCTWPANSPLFRKHREAATRLIEGNSLVRWSNRTHNNHLIVLSRLHHILWAPSAKRVHLWVLRRTIHHDLVSCNNKHTVHTNPSDCEFPVRRRKKPRMETHPIGGSFPVVQ